MKKRFDYLLTGASVVDIVGSANRLQEGKISGEKVLCLPYASKTKLQNVVVNTGGSALNIGITLDCLGGSVSLISGIGKDSFGDYVLSRLAQTGIDCSNIIRTNTLTGISVNLLHKGEKSTLVNHGAVGELSSSDVSEKIVKNVKMVVITSLPSKVNFGFFTKLLSIAKKHKKPVVFAPSMTMLTAFHKELRKLKYTFELLIMNYEEAKLFTKKSKMKDMLKAMPSHAAVITKDTHGSFGRDEDELLKINALPIKVLNTTGAGDVFCGSFIHTYFQNRSVRDALEQATGVAGMKLTSMESEVLCFPPQLGKFLKKYKKYLKVETLQ